MYYTVYMPNLCRISPFYMLLLFVVCSALMVRFMGSRSSYSLSPSLVTVSSKATGSIFDLPSKLECVPGPTKDASYYTKDLTPGGICGAQEFVVSQASYTITGGIGGSLMDQ